MVLETSGRAPRHVKRIPPAPPAAQVSNEPDFIRAAAPQFLARRARRFGARRARCRDRRRCRWPRRRRRGAPRPGPPARLARRGRRPGCSCRRRARKGSCGPVDDGGILDRGQQIACAGSQAARKPAERGAQARIERWRRTARLSRGNRQPIRRRSRQPADQAAMRLGTERPPDRHGGAGRMQKAGVARDRRRPSRAEGIAEPHHDLDHVAHRQPIDRGALPPRQRRRERDRSRRRRPRLKDGERNRDQRGARPQGRQRTAEGAARANLDAARAPLDAGHHGAETQPAVDARERPRQMLRQLIVAVAQVKDAVALLGFGRARLAIEPQHRDPLGVGGVEALDETEQHRSNLARQAARPARAPQHRCERHVLVGQAIHPRLRRTPAGAAGLDAAAPDERVPPLELDGAGSGPRERSHQPARAPVHELRAELDGSWPARGPLGANAAAQARARVDHHHPQAVPQQSLRRLEPRHAGADHDHIVFALGSSPGRGHAGAPSVSTPARLSTRVERLQ